jgi:hypothetical protein
MGKNKLLYLFAALVSLLAGHTADASSYYLSINGGASRLNDHCTNLAAGFTCKDTSLALSLDGGYQFNDTYGLELGFGYYGAPVTSGPVSGSTLDVTQSMTGLKFSGTASYPVSDSFVIGAKLGVSNTYLNVTSTVTFGPDISPYKTSTTSLLYGLGFRYNINRSFALQAQYENLGKIGDDTTGRDTLSMISAGIVYTFGDIKTSPQADSGKPARSTAIRPQLPPVDTTLNVVIFLENGVPGENNNLSNAIARACQCRPVFLRLQGRNAAKYRITLARGNSFTGFRTLLLNGGASLGIKVVMQDQ